MKKIILLLILLLCISCMRQFSSVKKLKKIEACKNNTALVAISSSYHMGVSKSKDVKFNFTDISNGNTIKPQFRDKQNNNLYFSVPPGTYKIALITIKEPTISKSILFDGSTNLIVKTIGLANAGGIGNTHLSGGGLSLSGAIIIGDKRLIYNDTISQTIQIEPNSAYFLGEYRIEGFVESFFNDMPNIHIEKAVPTSIEKLESFNLIVSQAFPNHKIIIDTTRNIFRTKHFELTKANSIKE